MMNDEPSSRTGISQPVAHPGLWEESKTWMAGPQPGHDGGGEFDVMREQKRVEDARRRAGVPRIHVCGKTKTWVAGTSPAKTIQPGRETDPISFAVITYLKASGSS